jgi:hypothetical protein
MNDQQQAIKTKIAKLLRMQKSDNAGEAANAAAFVEKLCREHGILPEEITDDYDPNQEVAVDFFYGAASKRLDPATCILLNYVANHFNGSVVRKWTAQGRRLHVFATQANQIQIELYTDYLVEQLKAIADRECPKGDRAYRNNFKKGFAMKIGIRLHEMKNEQRNQGFTEHGVPGLVLQERDEAQMKLADQYKALLYPSLARSTGFRMGSHGREAGASAAGSIGLNRQMKTKPTLSLSAASP